MARTLPGGEVVLDMPVTRLALILDDEIDRRVEMRRGLLDHGVRSDEASTVAEAILRLATGAYDLFVCDMVLCDPPGAANPAPRGYMAVCFALSSARVRRVVQASSYQRWRHRGALLTNWTVPEVADVVYGSAGIPESIGEDGGCLWSALKCISTAQPTGRPHAVRLLHRLPLVRELEGLAALSPVLDALEDAADGVADWQTALGATWRAFFPGAVNA
jgi:hypothetical protein